VDWLLERIAEVVFESFTMMVWIVGLLGLWRWQSGRPLSVLLKHLVKVLVPAGPPCLQPAN